MRLARISRPLFLLLFVALLLALNSLLQSISKRDFQFSSSPLFVFSLFNIIIVAIIVGNYRPHSGEDDEIIPFLYYPYELQEDSADDVEYTKNDVEDTKNDVDDDDKSEDFDSNGYDEDDDDNGSDVEIGWGDMDQNDSNLDKRFQDFIDKVNKEWREERLRDSHSNLLPLSYL